MFNKKHALALLFIAFLLTSYTPIGSNIINSISKPDCNSPEYKLAEECFEKPVKADDFRLKRFKFILCEIEGKCHSSRKEIANSILWGYDIVTKDYKKDLSLLNFAEGLNGYITYGSKNDLDLKLQEYMNFLNN